jgi:DNA invertase Pin-like site-specific DNA recombinase
MSANGKAHPLQVTLYARVSTRDQTAENQLQDLRRYAAARGFAVVGEYVDLGVSGAKDRRPELDKVMALARARAVDAVLVAGFDRFGRSLTHLVRALEEFQHLGVSFISLREQLDLGSPTGRVMFAVIAAMAEFERALIVERVHAGLRRARAQGKRIGRPRAVLNRLRIEQLRAEGLSWQDVARRMGLPPSTVYRYRGLSRTTSGTAPS